MIETQVTGNQWSVLPLSQVKEEGAYISKETGRLFQIPKCAIHEGHSPLFNVRGPNGDELLVRLTANPYTPVEKLRILASQANVEPRF